MRLIDADALAQNMQAITVTEVTKKGFRHLNRSVVLLTDVYKAPTIDAVPVVHGRWDFGRTFNHIDFYVCSECGAPTQGKPPFCCNCGAKMDKEEPT